MVGTIPKVEVSNRAPVLRAAATIFTAALFHLDVRGRHHLYRGLAQPYAIPIPPVPQPRPMRGQAHPAASGGLAEVEGHFPARGASGSA